MVPMRPPRLGHCSTRSFESFGDLLSRFDKLKSHRTHRVHEPPINASSTISSPDLDTLKEHSSLMSWLVRFRVSVPCAQLGLLLPDLALAFTAKARRIFSAVAPYILLVLVFNLSGFRDIIWPGKACIKSVLHPGL